MKFLNINYKIENEFIFMYNFNTCIFFLIFKYIGIFYITKFKIKLICILINIILVYEFIGISHNSYINVTFI